MKQCFSEGKLMKQFGNPPFLREHPLSTNPLIPEQFFMTLLCPNFKNKSPPLILGGGDYVLLSLTVTAPTSVKVVDKSKKKMKVIQVV